MLAYHDELFLAFPGIRSLNRKSWNVGHALHEKWNVLKGLWSVESEYCIKNIPPNRRRLESGQAVDVQMVLLTISQVEVLLLNNPVLVSDPVWESKVVEKRCRQRLNPKTLASSVSCCSCSFLTHKLRIASYIYWAATVCQVLCQTLGKPWMKSALTASGSQSPSAGLEGEMSLLTTKLKSMDSAILVSLYTK